LGIGTILAITGITLTIAGLIIFPNAENSLARVGHDTQLLQGVTLFDFSPVFNLDVVKSVSSSASNQADVESSFLIDNTREFCIDGDFLQTNEFLWSMKKSKVKF